MAADFRMAFVMSLNHFYGKRTETGRVETQFSSTQHSGVRDPRRMPDTRLSSDAGDAGSAYESTQCTSHISILRVFKALINES